MDDPWKRAAGPRAFMEEEPDTREDEPPPAAAEPPPQRHYPPRTCRICLEEVLPSYEPLTGGIPAILQPAPKVSYISADPSSGRLIRPCKCKGTQKYVHEGCLRMWRLADPASKRNFWECPTCKFRYRVDRMRWANWITSTATQILITFLIMLFMVFVFGFIADPIINLYVDPLETIVSIPSGGASLILEDEDAGWTEHFLKGMASMGLLGFAKVLFAMSPWQLFLRGGIGGGGGGRRRGGRDRLEGISWTVVVVGLVTFLFAVWAWVRKWTASTLEKAGQRVVDVQGAEDDDEDDETPAAQPNNATDRPETRKEQ